MSAYLSRPNANEYNQDTRNRKSHSDIPATEHVFKPTFQKTIKQIQKIFIQIDEDGSGSIDESEFIEIMKLMGIDLPDAKISEVFATIDADGGGDIDMVEFTEWWLSQEASDTTIRDDGAVVTNQNEFDLQTLKRDMADLDKMTAGMQSQLARITNLLGSKER